MKLQEIGQASGAITTLRIFGGVFGIAILTAVFTGSGGGLATSKAFADGFGPAMFAAAIVAFIGAIFGLGMPGRSRAASPVMAPPQSVPADQAASAR